MNDWNKLLEETVREINVLLEQQGMVRLPDLYKHMVLAIFRKGPRNIGWFQVSAQIAFEFLIKHGHISPDSGAGRMPLTAKGRKYNKRHRAEPPKKSEQFDRYWRRYVG